MSMALNLDTSALADVFDEIGEAFEAAARPAAQAGAQVLYDDARAKAGALGRVTGNLAGSIYQAYSAEHSGPGHATYHISWNARKAPHGGLVEFGHIQRYATYVGKDGQWYTAVRPEMRGKPRPKRRASQAEKDAYYVLRNGGPKQIPARSFIRSTQDKFPAALAAIEAELLKRIAT